MEALKLSDIACYLPYDLKWYHSNNNKLGNVTFYNVNTIINGVNNQNYKILLHPISNLYKPLENGDIPIVKLAKVAFPYHTWQFKDDMAISDTEEGKLCFIYVRLADYFRAYYDYRLNKIDVPNQTQLFDYLNEHHFDYKNLINRGFAIDINTIKL